jgi:PilZ domain
LDVFTIALPPIPCRQEPRARPKSRDRRAAPRFLASRCRARVSWRVDPMQLRIEPARLVDVSETGARLEFAERPNEPVQEIWISLGDAPLAWVRADVKHLRGDPTRRRWWLHVAFDEDSPVDLVRGALGVEEK